MERDMPEVEKHNLDMKFERERFGMDKETDQQYLQNIKETHSTILETMMGKDYDSFFLNDEGEDVRDLAERAEQQREAEWDHKMEAWAEKHQHDRN